MRKQPQSAQAKKTNIKTTLWGDDTFIIVVNFYLRGGQNCGTLESDSKHMYIVVCVWVGVCLRCELAENLGCIYCTGVCFCCRLLILV